jgi:Ca2+/H+ antiporter
VHVEGPHRLERYSKDIAALLLLVIFCFIFVMAIWVLMAAFEDYTPHFLIAHRALCYSFLAEAVDRIGKIICNNEGAIVLAASSLMLNVR